MFKHLEEHGVDNAAFRSSCRPASVMYVGNWTGVFVSYERFQFCLTTLPFADVTQCRR